MELGAPTLRQPIVGDVADEDVLEVELAVAGDASTRLAGRMKSRRSSASSASARPLAAAGEMRNGALPEDASDDGGLLRDALLPARERVEARADQCLQALGHGVGRLEPQPRSRGGRVGQHPNRLLEEERVSARFLEQDAAYRAVSAARRRPGARAARRSPSLRAARARARGAARRGARSRARAQRAPVAPVPTTSNGPLLADNERMSSSSVGSAQWRSSNTRTSGRAAARSSRKRPMPQ